ncbi:hypothetical protein SAMN06265220_10774 [Flavobacterium nitrogenifigens]|uniref:Uncharacterized protein n=2 Tax=Flavobacterium nitrogenifigens TaxID=1617283 RepID=A0A521FAA4_9FLAO|nr:hypothetical protein SAMN06265220_10774 [Flavobacterium nitrogenifigens]
MYRINSQFAHFDCIPEWEKMLVNITWYNFKPQGKFAGGFTKAEMDQFRAFLYANPLHFPGPNFEELCSGEDFDIALHRNAAKAGMPHDKRQRNHKYSKVYFF